MLEGYKLTSILCQGLMRPNQFLDRHLLITVDIFRNNTWPALRRKDSHKVSLERCYTLFMGKKKMKIKYNSSVILTYSIISLCVLSFCGSDFIAKYFSSPAQLSFVDSYFYLRLVLYIAGHGSWDHLVGNLMIILLVGPLLEEKYGSGKLLEMILVTAIATGILNAFLFSTSLIGGSGIAFMLILLGSFSNIRSKEIPLTFIIIAVLFIGSEIVSTLKVDRISQFSHLAGGLVGAIYGFIRSGRR